MTLINKAFNSTIFHNPTKTRQSKILPLSEHHLRIKRLQEFKSELRSLDLSESEIQTALKFQSY